MRGRVLLASANRNGLIRALTLTPEDALGQEALEATQQDARDEILHARVQLDPETPGGAQFESVEARLWLDPEAGRAQLRAELRPELQEAWGPVLLNATPGTLYAPPHCNALAVEFEADSITVIAVLGSSPHNGPTIRMKQVP